MNPTSSILRRMILAGGAPVLFAALALQPGCSTTQAMIPDRGVAANEGTVTATAGDNGDTLVNVRVRHLAPASRVAADSTVYVVWIQPREGVSKSVGALLISGDLDGRLETVTPHHRFRLQVTPEPNARAAHPTHDPVFSADLEGTR